jgi:hypothetical protein
MTAAGAEVGSTTRVAETIHGILEAGAAIANEAHRLLPDLPWGAG